MSYAGTNEQKVYDLDGNLLADVTGTSAARKISPWLPAVCHGRPNGTAMTSAPFCFPRCGACAVKSHA
jgi:hypothetical protein